MADQSISVGCVEDHAPDVSLLKHALTRTRIDLRAFVHVERLAEMKKLEEANVDVILLDLGLPDSVGMDTVVRARELASATPLIVLTGSNESGRAAIAAGADDFLDKELIGDGQLARIVEYAVERNRLRVRLEHLENERELQKIKDRSQPPRSQTTASLLGDRSLSEAAPDVHRQSVEEFAAVVRSRLQNNAMGVATPEDDRMRQLGDRIAVRNAGPEDVVSILTEAVDNQRLHLSPSQYAPFVREARIALIELMGFVLSFYRRHAPVGLVQQAEPSARDDPATEKLAPPVDIRRRRQQSQAATSPASNQPAVARPDVIAPDRIVLGDEHASAVQGSTEKENRT